MENAAVPADYYIVFIVDICLKVPMHIEDGHVSICLPDPIVTLKKALPGLHLRPGRMPGRVLETAQMQVIVMELCVIDDVLCCRLLPVLLQCEQQ